MKPATVLVVEDERVVAMHLRQQLSRLGYQVPAMATSGPQALKQITDLRPDVVLMDIHIEGRMDGIETASRIPLELRIPVIYLTAYSEEATLERARQTKPYGYLLKPFSERELHAAIQMVLERRRVDNLLEQGSQRLEELVAARTEELNALNLKLQAETTERLNAERALSHSQKMEAVGQLTGGIAHDFNNLMQVVIGSLSVLSRLIPNDHPHADLTQKALSAARSAAGLTKRLLAFARRQPLMPKPLNLNEFVGGMSDLLRRALGETVVVEMNFEEELWLTEADPSQMESIILNLVLNARDAMPGGGRLMIETQNVEIEGSGSVANIELKPGSYVVLCVSDTGCGMDKDILGRAFEPFFTTKDVGQGTGLGLSQVYGFVKQSGGHVRLYSEVGQGTSAKIYLPRFVGAVPKEAPAVVSITSSGGKERILIVEDQPDVRAFSIQVLRDLGYEVLEAPDGPMALQILQQHKGNIDLLFTDVVLPAGLDGASLAAQALALSPQLKVLYTTGYPRNALVRQGRIDSGVELITKPFTDIELGARIRLVLDRAASQTVM
jgi:signal transduction histidine kinase